jgi:multidrug transporter EmrE-like cation transporter
MPEWLYEEMNDWSLQKLNLDVCYAVWNCSHHIGAEKNAFTVDV